MAVTFLEPGGDADFAVTTTNGFWGSLVVGPTIVTDFLHGKHVRSISFNNSSSYGAGAVTPSGVVSDSGGRVSFYLYIVSLPAAAAKDSIMAILKSDGTTGVAWVAITSGGVLRMYSTSAAVQIGSDGPPLVAGTWYRISLAYTITSTAVNRFELFVDSKPAISITNATLVNVTSSCVGFGAGLGVLSGSSSTNLRGSDFYVDNSSSLTDTGDIWVTAKRPNANGTTNGFSTQIGAGGSGYGSGHSPQVNERALSVTNGWSMVGAGSAVTEEYNIENAATGDINITNEPIVDYMGWVSTSSLAGETINIILNGVNFAQAITSTNTMYKKYAGSTQYPAGTGTDIGIQTDTSLTTVSLFECGVVIAFKKANTSGPTIVKPGFQNRIRAHAFSPGRAR